MITKGFRLGILALSLAFAGISVAAGAELRAIHMSTADSSAQVTLDLTGQTPQKLFTLDHPNRVVLDLRNTHVAYHLRTPDATGVVSDIRVGTQPGGVARVVLQTKTALPAHSAWLQLSNGQQQLLLTLGDPPAPVAFDSTPKVIHAAHAPADGDRDVVVAVDAGHGGQDPGAIGHGGTREKDVTLAIARLLAERINDQPGMRAVLTRDRDEFVVLRDRIGRARLAKADMFISIHADSIANRDVSGASVYVLSEHGATNEAARWLAERENAADLMGGVKLGDKDNTLASVLMDLSQSANISASMTAAERVLTSLDGVGEVRKSQVQQAGFVVLKSPDIPSMLVETAYISNPVEELRLKSQRQQSRLAEAIFTGMRGYFEEFPPAGTHLAQVRHGTIASAANNPPPTMP